MKPEQSKRVVNEQNPYLGLASFTEQHKSYFCGRTSETNKLYKLVRNHAVTVLFGSSGRGKTSLLQAGLLPLLRKDYYLPIYIRVVFNDQSRTPIDQVKSEISEQVSKVDGNALPIGSLSLWEYFHQVEILKGLVTPVLIFDQFEEIFTLGKDRIPQVKEFMTELADLVENQVPISVQKKYQNKDISFPFQHQKCRVILSLREDYLPNLEKYNERIPSTKRSRFRVTAMGRDRALEAIIKPGKKIIDGEEADLILTKIIESADYKDNDDIQNFEFEPFLLSFICEQINEVRLEKKEEKISSNLIDGIDIKDLIRKHYNQNTSTLEKQMIEDRLLTMDDHRNFQILDEIYLKYKRLNEENISALISKRIIRKAIRNKIVFIELIHDVMIPVIRESRDLRLKNELKKAAHKKRLKERKVLVSILVPVVIALISAVIWGIKEQNELKLLRDVNNIGLSIVSVNALIDRVQEIKETNPTLALKLDNDALVKLESARCPLLELKANRYRYNTVLRDQKYDSLRAEYLSSALILKTQTDSILNSDHTFFKNVTQENPDSKLAKLQFVNGILPHYSDSSSFRVWQASNNLSDAISSDSVSQVVFPEDNKAMVLYANGTAGYRSSTGPYRPVYLDSLGPDIRITSIAPIRYKEIGYKMLSVLSNHKIVEWNLNGTIRQSPKIFNDTIRKGEKVVYRYDRNIKLNSRLISIAISPNRAKIFTASDEGSGIVWFADTSQVEIRRNKEIQFFLGQDSVICSAFSHDGKKIATGARDGTVKIWSSEGQKEVKFIKELKGHTGAVTSVAFSSHDYFVYTGSLDGTFKRWHLSTGSTGKDQGMSFDMDIDSLTAGL